MSAAVLPTPYYEDGAVTIYHGDCREHWLAFAWQQADVVITDPPYGMSFASGMDGAHAGETIAGDDDTSLRDWMLGEWADLPALVMGRWSIPRPAGTRMVLTWDKGGHVGMGDLRLPWKPNTEEVYVVGSSSGFTGFRGSSVLRYNAVAGCVGTRNTGDRNHLTEKPVDLFRALVAKTVGVIADPFMGSGTTLRAAKDLGRKAIGVEIEERYCEIAAKRCAQEVLDFGAVA